MEEFARERRRNTGRDMYAKVLRNANIPGDGRERPLAVWVQLLWSAGFGLSPEFKSQVLPQHPYASDPTRYLLFHLFIFQFKHQSGRKPASKPLGTPALVTKTAPPD